MDQRRGRLAWSSEEGGPIPTGAKAYPETQHCVGSCPNNYPFCRNILLSSVTHQPRIRQPLWAWFPSLVSTRKRRTGRLFYGRPSAPIDPRKSDSTTCLAFLVAAKRLISQNFRSIPPHSSPSQLLPLTITSMVSAGHAHERVTICRCLPVRFLCAFLGAFKEILPARIAD